MQEYEQIRQKKKFFLQIPINPESISPDWLTKALYNAKTIKQSRVKSVVIQPLGPGEGYMGQLIHLRLDYTSREEGAPLSLIVKLSHIDPKIRVSLHESGYYETEIRFYQDLALKVHLPIPYCYYSDIDSNTGNSILLLEDLSKDYKKLDFSKGCSFEQSELVIRLLAKFHAYWWENSHLMDYSYLTSHNDKGEYWQEQFQEWWSRLPLKLSILLPDYQIPSTFIKLGDNFGANLMKIFTKMSQHPITLIHKDTHLNNLLFNRLSSKENGLKVIDWQTAGYGRGVSDVTHFIVASLQVDSRRRSEERLLKTYHSLLMKYGVKNYDFDQCWIDYELAAFRNIYIIAVLVNVLDTSSPQGKSLLRTLLPRVITFSEDHSIRKYL